MGSYVASFSLVASINHWSQGYRKARKFPLGIIFVVSLKISLVCNIRVDKFCGFGTSCIDDCIDL